MGMALTSSSFRQVLAPTVSYQNVQSAVVAGSNGNEGDTPLAWMAGPLTAAEAASCAAARESVRTLLRVTERILKG